VPPTPFPWSWDISEERAEQLLADAPARAVMVIHSPPYGHADRAFGRNLGSRAVLRAIEQLEPPLVICGHIHQCWGERSELGPTRIINAGPRGTFLEL
jgi:Icc-related predicted phosphoesterase